MKKQGIKNRCKQCNKVISGRADKEYCDDKCKNEYNNILKYEENKEIGPVNNILKQNRRILLRLLDGRQSKSVSERQMFELGFVFLYFTHVYFTEAGNKEYKYCYNYGYCAIREGWYNVVKSYIK
jgi:hypothetical protein